MRHHDDLVHEANGVRAKLISRRSFLASATAAGFSLAFAQGLLERGASAATLAQDEPPKGGQVIVGLSQEPTIFNPLKSTLEVDRGAQMAIFDSLWRINEGAELIPNLATEIPTVENGGISEDGLTYTFKLRDDAKWHDGEPFTAADVVIGSNVRWGVMFKLVPERPEFTAYAQRIAARPAAQRAEAKDQELGAK